jgi:hypothetical protein
VLDWSGEMYCEGVIVILIIKDVEHFILWAILVLGRQRRYNSNHASCNSFLLLLCGEWIKRSSEKWT